MRATLLLVGLLALQLASFAAAEQTVTVQTADGPVVGYLNPQGSYSFKGLPFAAPPVGDLRFAAPQPVTPWTAPRNATVFGPGCYSKCNGKFTELMCARTVSEDCLYLNVFTPTLNASANLPVIFFIHGGMFDWGSGGIPLYEGNEWAVNHSVVLVTINYRLNIFGALRSPTPGSATGNYMILDQRAALQWVQANIGAFGGDKTRVLLSGQSAGATSVGVHLVAPGSWGLFSRAGIISDPYGLIPMDTKMAESMGDWVLMSLGCPVGDAAAELACLRNASTEAIFKLKDTDVLPLPNEVLAMFMQWIPVVDGVILPAQPLDAMAAGASADVPLLIGTVANETIPFIFGISFNTTDWEMDIALDYIFGTTVGAQVAELYGPVPADQQGDTRPFFSRIFTDYTFYCPTRYAAMNQAVRNKNRVYSYFFDEHPSWSLWYSGGNPNDPCVKWICHAFDLPSIFNTYFKLPAGFPQPTAEEFAMGVFQQTSWSQFAATGAIPGWEVFNSTTLVARNISIPIETSGYTHAYREKYCAFFDSIGYDRW